MQDSCYPQLLPPFHRIIIDPPLHRFALFHPVEIESAQTRCANEVKRVASSPTGQGMACRRQVYLRRPGVRDVECTAWLYSAEPWLEHCGLSQLREMVGGYADEG